MALSVPGNAEGRELRAGDGRRLVLGALIKSGGAGSVYRLREDASLVAKLYHDNVDLRMYERKVEAMLTLSPELPDLFESDRRYVQIAWPRALLRDARNRFVGYLMPAVDVKATSELECVLQEKQARALGLPTGLGAKITLAANLAGVIAELHRQQHRVVDLKPVNLRFYPGSLYMAMLDCDGFSIQGKGERFEAPQCTVDYLAPEFQRGGLEAAGEEAQDRFALAVIVFQLLNFGIHPFTGRPANEGVPTDIPGRITARLYAYGQRGNARLLPSPASGHESMPAELRVLFDRAFEGVGLARPSALEWGSVLRGYAQRSSLRLSNCTRQREHQHFAGLPCAACARASLLARTAKGTGTPAARAAPGAMAATRVPGRVGVGARRPTGSAFQRARAANAAQVVIAPAPAPRRRGAPLWPINPSPLPVLQGANYARRSSPRMGCFQVLIIAIVFIVVFLVALGVVMKSALPPPGPDIRPLTPRTQVEPPTAPADATLPPIAAHLEELAIVATPSWQEIEQTRVDAQWAAIGAADNNRLMFDNAMGSLRRVLHDKLPVKAEQRLQAHHRWMEFAAAAPAFDVDQREQSMRALAGELELKVDDAQLACEWSWLALLDSRRDYAFDGFLRTIWADPQYECGWLGLGALSQDTRGGYGALVLAERLRLGSEDDRKTRDALVEAAMAPQGLERWRILDARARVHEARLREWEVPADIRERAGQPLPDPLRGR